VSRHTHGDEHNEQIDPDGEVCQEAELLESTDLTEEEASNGPNNNANGIAEPKLANLRKRFTVADKYNRNIEQQLQRLKDQDKISGPATEQSKGKVSICSHREFVGVKT
jgi:hypothetical protein